MKFFRALALSFLIVLSSGILGKVVSLSGWESSTALANPFTQKSLAKEKPAPLPLNVGFSLTLIQWQRQLKARMSHLVREARKEGQYVPVLLVLLTAFVYGMVHSAGPGHGKAVAGSYILGARPGLIRGLAFGNVLAMTHATSGMILVILVKRILETSMTASLDQVTRYTQIISFSLICLLGLYLFAQGLAGMGKAGNPDAGSVPEKGNVRFSSAVIMGLIPCPGVVMVLLFCMSMDAFWLGIAMGISIGVGMALTISAVIVLAILGKRSLLAGAGSRPGLVRRVETFVQAGAGLLVAALGGLFLWGAI